jgi:pimeloyl-ACP methyl ester carboxylesterase
MRDDVPIMPRNRDQPVTSRGTAPKIPGAEFQMMKGLGHFPMSESPEVFLEYLRPALARLRASPAG